MSEQHRGGAFVSIPATTQVPTHDQIRITGLIRALASGMIVPTELAERAYRIGSESCHRAMQTLDSQASEEPFDLRKVEKATIRKALLKCNGNKLDAARLLGIGKTTLYRKIAAYALDPLRTLRCPSCGCEISFHGLNHAKSLHFVQRDFEANPTAQTR
jgi:DNA-binding protein Fis